MNALQYPIEIPWSAVVDKNGNATHTENLGKDGWYNLAVSGQLSKGNGNWSFSRNLSFLRPAVGSQVHVPIGLTAPGSRVDITISNASIGAVVSGLIYGQKAFKPQYLTDIGGLDDYATNTIIQSGPQQNPILDIFNIQPTVSVVNNYTLPAGTTAIILFINNTGSNTSINFGVAGVNSGTTYYSTPSLASEPIGTPIVVTGILPQDTAANGITITVNAGATGIGQNIEVSFSVINTIFGYNTFHTPLHVIPGSMNLLYAKQAIAFGGTGTTAIVIANPSVANSRIRLHRLRGVFSIAANNAYTLQDNAANFIDWITSGLGTVDFLYDSELAIGQGLEFVHTTGASTADTFNGSVQYTLEIV